MTDRAKELLHRFLALRNVIPLLIIVVAFIGTFITSPFGLQREQILLGLLAFLAIDALVERIEMLANIERDVQALKELATSQTVGRDFLRLKADFPRIEHLISEAKQEIWLSGVALDTMVWVTGIFNSKLEQGFKLRLLMVAPKENVLQETSHYFGGNADELAARITASLNRFYKELVQIYPQQVEIRLMDHRPILGYFIVDPHLEQGYMTVEPYLYRIDRNRRPMFILSKRDDARWFSIYIEGFEKLWNNATKWEP